MEESQQVEIWEVSTMQVVCVLFEGGGGMEGRGTKSFYKNEQMSASATLKTAMPVHACMFHKRKKLESCCHAYK